MPEMCKNHLLERVDLVLEIHQVRDGLVSASPISTVVEVFMQHYTPFVGIVNSLQGHVLLIFEETVKFGSQTMEAKLCKNELDIGSDQWSVTCNIRLAV